MKAPTTDTRARVAPPQAAAGAVADGRTCIVAGGGSLPLEVADALAAAGTPPFVLMVEGEANPAAMAHHEGVVVPVGALTARFGLLKEKNIRNIVLAGNIRSRPGLLSLRADRHVLAALPKALATLLSLGHGDDKLLRSITGMLEGQGLRVVGVHEIVPDLLVAAGPAGRHSPRKADEKDIARAWRAAKAIGALDIGQGAVAVHGRVVAVEGAEGTDAMLERVRMLRETGRIPARAGGVLVKCAKPGQELRADLPAIGPPTIANASAAGLGGIVLEAGRALILEQKRTIELADEAKLFVAGRQEDELGTA